MEIKQLIKIQNLKIKFINCLNHGQKLKTKQKEYKKHEGDYRYCNGTKFATKNGLEAPPPH